MFVIYLDSEIFLFCFVLILVWFLGWRILVSNQWMKFPFRMIGKLYNEKNGRGIWRHSNRPAMCGVVCVWPLRQQNETCATPQCISYMQANAWLINNPLTIQLSYSSYHHMYTMFWTL